MTVTNNATAGEGKPAQPAGEDPADPSIGSPQAPSGKGMLRLASWHSSASIGPGWPSNLGEMKVVRLEKIAHHDWKHSHPIDLSDEGSLGDLEDRLEGAAQKLVLVADDKEKKKEK